MLSKPAFGPPYLALVSLVFVGLMWVLPFLHYRHAYPLTTFYQEWGAAVLGLCAMPLLAARHFWQQPEIPRIVLLPIGLIALVLVQFALDKVAYFDQALLLTLYLLWAALLIMLGRCLREEMGMPALAAALAVFLLLGAELNALVGILQHYRWHTFLDAVVTVKISSSIYGNVAQPNHFANYIALGLISLGLLQARWPLRAWQVALLAAPLLFVLVLSGSRSSWLYLLCMAGMAFLWQRSDKSCAPLLRYSLLLLLGFGLMHFVVQIPWLAGASGSITTVQRLFGEASSGSIRLYLWREAWLIFTQYPLLGAGFGQFAWQHFQLGPVLRDTNIVGLYNNAHNLVLHMAAEMGLVGLLILFGTLAQWVWRAGDFTRNPGSGESRDCIAHGARSIYSWWGCALLAVLAIHSLLEYPLWYAYFMGVAAFTLGMLDTAVYRLELRGVGRLSVAAILLLGLLSLSQMLQGYRDLEGLVAMRPASATDQEFSMRMRDGLGQVYGQSLLRPYAEMLMSGMMETSADRLAAKRALNENVMRFVPVSTVVYREAWLLALADEPAGARLQIERAIWSYPDSFPAAREKLRALALKDPAHFASLLEFALQKNEERQHAIPAR